MAFQSRAGGAIPTNDWTAIVLAGERPGGDPLARELRVPAKALIKIGGRTMLSRVVQALLDSTLIGKVLVLAQEIECIAACEPSGVLHDPRVELARSGNGIASSIEAVAGTLQAPWPVLVTTADNALLTTERIDEFLANTNGTDIAVGLGERAIVEAAFPDTRRTWLKFSDGHFSGANLFALRNDKSRAAVRHWQAIEQDRKKGLKLIASFGPLLLVRALTRTIGLRDGLARAGRKMGFGVRAVVLDAEAPIDVDKMEDLALVEQILAHRQTRLCFANAASPTAPACGPDESTRELEQPARAARRS